MWFFSVYASLSIANKRGASAKRTANAKNASSHALTPSGNERAAKIRALTVSEERTDTNFTLRNRNFSNGGWENERNASRVRRNPDALRGHLIKGAALVTQLHIQLPQHLHAESQHTGPGA